MADPLLILLGLLVLYMGFLFWLLRTGRMQKWDLSLMLGVVLMQRTQRGKRTIDFIARPRRFWNLIGDLGILLTLSGMVTITLFFLWSITIVLQPSFQGPAFGLREILVIPGVNPFVPLWYGLAALAITLVVHEGGHGILARANGMKLKSLGLLWFVVPIGAFVEPEELDLKVASRRNRLRVFGAGPAVNIGVAAITLACFGLLMGLLVPQPGAWIAQVTQDGEGNDLPAKAAGIVGGDIVVSAARVGPGGDVMPAQAIPDWPALSGFIGNSTPGQDVRFGMGDGRTAQVTLASTWSLLSEEQRFAVTAASPQGNATCQSLLPAPAPTGPECASRLQAQARMGVTQTSHAQLAFLAHPFTSGGAGFAYLVALPIQEVLQKQPVLSVYAKSFYDTPFHAATFWVVVMMLFWVFWINLMVGITNILPMLPLDGGHIFREAVGGAMARIRPRLAAERRDRIVSRMAAVMSLIIFAALLIQILAPHVIRAF